MTLLFRAKTYDGHTVKILSELLQNNIKSGCFEIDEKAIYMRMMDSQRRLLVDITLDSDNFVNYNFNAVSKLYIGINFQHLHKMLKSVKKKDIVILFIDKSCTELGIKILPKENNRITTSFIKIQDIQNLDIDLPCGYSRPIIIPSTDLQKTIKDLSYIGSIIGISSYGGKIKFNCNAGNIYSREIVFGDNDEEEKIEAGEYNQSFDAQHLLRILKITGLSSNISIFICTNLPILLKTNIGSIGTIALYIKSKEQIENDN